MFLRVPKILLVEDDKLIQKIHRNFLEGLGCQVTVVGDAVSALSKTLNDCDLIITDIGLPAISGLEISHLIRYRTKNENKRVPIIACTGFGDLVHEQLEWAGIDDLLVKPATPEDLEAMLKKWLPLLIR